jgi:hypothetical protein
MENVRHTNLWEAQMTENKALDREAAKQQPETVFDRPLEIVDQQLLTKGEKLATLERWRQTILEQARAMSGGMATDGNTAKQTGVLDEIEEARRRITEREIDQTSA